MANQAVRLLKLPPEIRLLIYEYLFPAGVEIDTLQQRFHDKYWPVQIAGLGLLRTCKLLSEEASQFLYSKNWFMPQTIRRILKPRSRCTVCGMRICTHQRVAMPTLK